MLAVGYPGRSTIAGLFLSSLFTTALAVRYLRCARGALRISGRGITYLPTDGKPILYPWKELARVTVLPGWLSVYDRDNRRVLSFAYGLGKQHTLHGHMLRQLEGGDARPEIWPILSAETKVAKRTRRKATPSAATLTGTETKKAGAKRITKPRPSPSTRTIAPSAVASRPERAQRATRRTASSTATGARSTARSPQRLPSATG
jgi:hypothetical protein